MLSDDELIHIYDLGFRDDAPWREGELAGLRAVASTAARSALEEAADAWHAENAGASPRAYKWLRARAASIPTTTRENKR